MAVRSHVLARVAFGPYAGQPPQDCLDACVPAYYRYELGDGTALIVRAYQGEMPPGWMGEGQGQWPASCPVVEVGEME